MSTSSPLSRRSLLRMAAVTGAIAATSSAVVLGSADAASANGTQSNWRYCQKCSLLWFAGQPLPSNGCPAGGQHSSNASGNYSLKLYPNGNGQQGWQFCGHCYVMYFFTPGNPFAVCPITDSGDHGDNGQSGNYIIEFNGSTDGPGGQTDWRYCLDCTGLFFTDSGGESCFSSGLTHQWLTTNHNYVLREV